MHCPRCAHENSEAAAYCNVCGQQMVGATAERAKDLQLWRQFIGPRADYYLERFRAFQKGEGDRFAPTWHWPAFGVGWLWYLYRKMYLHAAVFLIGGLLPMFLGAGLVGAVIWNGFAAITANFLYYMHVKMNLVLIERRTATDTVLRDRLIADTGGIQPYVWWLGIALMALAIGFGLIQAPAPKE
jgi:hypothetical protein